MTAEVEKLQPFLDFEDAIKDTPSFRWRLRRVEQQIDAQSSQIEKVSKACDAMVDKGYAYERSVTTFLTSLRALGDCTAYRRDEQLIDTLSRLAAAMEDVQAYRVVLLQQAKATIAESLRSFLVREVAPVRDLKKMYHKMSDDLDAIRNRRASCQPNRQGEMADAENMNKALHAGFNHVALDYVFRLNLLLMKEKDEIIEKSAAFVNENATFFKQGQDYVEDLRPFLRDVSQQVRTNMYLVCERAKILKRQTMRVSASKEMEGTLQTVQRRHLDGQHETGTEESRLIHEGYLYKRSTNAFKIWNRRYFLLRDGQLLYLKRDKEEIPKPYVPDLRICTVKSNPSESVDRTYCFEIITPTRSYLLQAESAAEKDEWVAAIQASIGAALHLVHAPATERINYAAPQVEESDAAKTADRARESERMSLQAGILDVPGNRVCADCRTSNPTWVSINLGITLCIQCSGVHRSLGSHLSKVRSLNLDRIEPEVLRELGNNHVNSVLESDNELADEHRPTSSSSREILEQFILNKYACKKYGPAPVDKKQLEKSLFDATRNGKVQTVSSLLLQGVDINVLDPQKQSPLMLAAATGGPVMVEYLLLNGAEKDSMVDAELQTALHLAAIHRHFLETCLLVKAGCRVDIKDQAGRTPVDYALEHQDADMVTMMRLASLSRELGDDDFDVDNWISIGMDEFSKSQTSSD